MPAALLFLLGLSAGALESAPPAEKTTVLVLDLEAPELSEVEGKTLTAVVATSLSEHSQLDVVTSDDVRRLMDLEGQRQAMSCDDDSCLADIAGALGAERVVFGKVGRLGSTLVLELNLFDARRGNSVARELGRAPSVETLADGIPALVSSLLRLPTAGVSSVSTGEPGGWWPPSPLAAGVLLGIGGLGAVASLGLLIGAEWALQDTSGSVGREGKDLALVLSPVGAVGAAVLAPVALVGAALLVVGLLGDE